MNNEKIYVHSLLWNAGFGYIYSDNNQVNNLINRQL